MCNLCEYKSQCKKRCSSCPCSPCPSPCPPPCPCSPCQSQCRPCCNRKSKKCKKCPKYYPFLAVECGCVAFTFSKSANPTTFSTVGQIINYTYTITNIGSAIICYPIQICDDKLGGWRIPNAYIAPGSSQSFTRTYTIVASDITTGSITNTANAFVEVCPKKLVCAPPATATITLVIT